VHWDYRIFVSTRMDLARARGITRDAGLLGGPSQAEHIYDARYHAHRR